MADFHEWTTLRGAEHAETWLRSARSRASSDVERSRQLLSESLRLLDEASEIERRLFRSEGPGSNESRWIADLKLAALSSGLDCSLSVQDEAVLGLIAAQLSQIACEQGQGDAEIACGRLAIILNGDNYGRLQ